MNNETLDNENKIVESFNLIVKNIRHTLYIEYETNILIDYITKYPSIMKKFANYIFIEYMEHFMYLHKLYDKHSLSNNSNLVNFLISHSMRRIIPEKKMEIFCQFVFSDEKNKIDKKYINKILCFISGYDMIKFYIMNGGTFNVDETKILINSIGENPIQKISDMVIKLIENHNVFAVNKDLIEYAAYIPINMYVLNGIQNNQKITQQCYYNIIKYSNDLNLCEIALKSNENLLNSECLNYACESKNKEILLFILNNKISIKNNILNSVFNNKKTESCNINKIKIHNFNDVYLYSEPDQYNNESDSTSLLIRTIKKDNYCNEVEIINIIDKYGYYFTDEDFLIGLNNCTLINNIEFDYNNEENMKKFWDICAHNSFYPYFINKSKYPHPTYYCLFKECEKKNNIKMIKRLSECLNLGQNLNEAQQALNIANNIQNNIRVIKYFMENYKITPTIKNINKHMNNCNDKIDYFVNIKKIEYFAL
jgi:hypothetical protein